tara:strand:- start:572 stop:910 length:339 start_codon:yes stop_codon:yes gene_type:complete
MNITEEITTPIIALVHFLNEEMIEQAGGRLVHYSVTLYPSKDGRTQLSPSSEFIRFGDVQGDEIQGWQPASNIAMDETLFTYDGMESVPFQTQLVEVQGVDDAEDTRQLRSA